MRKRSIWQREKTTGLVIDRPWKWLLLPGIIFQWFLYMFPSGGFGRVASDTRISRSPLMTYYLSAVVYVGVFILIVSLWGK
jgi:hypothetical protein